MHFFQLISFFWGGRKKRRFCDLRIFNLPETQSGANTYIGFASLASANALRDWVSL